jgi:hypothetical protein
LLSGRKQKIPTHPAGAFHGQEKNFRKKLTRLRKIGETSSAAGLLAKVYETTVKKSRTNFI